MKLVGNCGTASLSQKCRVGIGSRLRVKEWRERVSTEHDGEKYFLYKTLEDVRVVAQIVQAYKTNSFHEENSR